MKKSSTLLATIFCCLTVLSLCGCPPKEQPSPSALSGVTQPAPTDYDLSLITTVGNHSYIPINKLGKSKDMIVQILGLLQAFENQHPELEVTGWQIEKQPLAHFVSAQVYGLWIDHQPKK